ncbi:MAG: hypothetical protein CMN04_05225 [Roseibacillus sp.]|nr:hypothetical protein [Roseibacillus sp.]
MPNKPLMKRILTAVTISILSITSPAFADKKLKVFILAGQSNTVGHANQHTLATLYRPGDARDERLAKLVFKNNSGLSAKALQEQLERGEKIDVITGGISNEKLKALAEGPEKTAAEAELKTLNKAYDAYTEKVISACVVSDRVHISSIADGNKRSGPLTVGFGGNPTKIGPEFTFGLSMAQKLDGPILLIKTSWGGKSINYDFRPPSAGPYTLNDKQKEAKNAADIRKNAGLNWRMMNEAIGEVLKDLKKYHPAYDATAGHEMAGFVWFQGFNDQFSDEFRENYRDMMVHFIKDVRKEYDTPGMPFVIGVLGTNMTKEGVDKNAVSVAQREAAKAPEFKDNVTSVESYQVYDLGARAVYDKGWAKNFAVWRAIGSDRPYHYLGSGTFFARLGDSFATAMAELIGKQKK